MRAKGLALFSMMLLSGCRIGTRPPAELIAADQHVLPPNTVMLSQMMREMSAQPGFTDALLAQIDKGEKTGALLTPKLFDEFRKLILGKDWSGLDRFPGWTIVHITRTVDLGKELITPASDEIHVDVGPNPLRATASEDLGEPSDRSGFQLQQTRLGNDVLRGDGPDPRLAPMHAQSLRLAQVMNRLALNHGAATFSARIDGQTATTPEQLIAALVATGHSVTVADVRYFANFGHFHYQSKKDGHYNGQDVEMPFWLDTQTLVPTDHWWQRSRHLLVPVAHAEYEWIVTGPKVNADVTFYLGIDGHAEFRTNDELNQPWVMGRHAREYRGADVVEVTRLSGKFVRAYAELHAKHPEMPFGGYYTLGVCQDVVGAIEQHMTGATTLFPNTAKTKYFHEQTDAEVTSLMEAVTKDTAGAPVTLERIFGSLPTTDLNAITIPGLRDDLLRVQQAMVDGRVEHAVSMRRRLISWAGVLLATAMVLLIARRRRSSR